MEGAARWSRAGSRLGTSPLPAPPLPLTEPPILSPWSPGTAVLGQPRAAGRCSKSQRPRRNLRNSHARTGSRPSSPHAPCGCCTRAATPPPSPCPSALSAPPIPYSFAAAPRSPPPALSSPAKPQQSAPAAHPACPRTTATPAAAPPPPQRSASSPITSHLAARLPHRFALFSEFLPCLRQLIVLVSQRTLCLHQLLGNSRHYSLPFASSSCSLIVSSFPSSFMVSSTSSRCRDLLSCSWIKWVSFCELIF